MHSEWKTVDDCLQFWLTDLEDDQATKLTLGHLIANSSLRAIIRDKLRQGSSGGGAVPVVLA